MSRSLNKVQLIGNLGAPPEIRRTGTGKAVANLSLATSRTWTGRDGIQQQKTEWHRIVAWDKLADIAEQYMRKGTRLYVEGSLEYRSYEDAQGVTRYVTEVRAQEVIMLDAAPSNNDATPEDENLPLPVGAGA